MKAKESKTLSFGVWWEAFYWALTVQKAECHVLPNRQKGRQKCLAVVLSNHVINMNPLITHCCTGPASEYRAVSFRTALLKNLLNMPVLLGGCNLCISMYNELEFTHKIEVWSKYTNEHCTRTQIFRCVELIRIPWLCYSHWNAQ